MNFFSCFWRSRKTPGKDPLKAQANGISTQAVSLSTHSTPLSTLSTKLSTPATASSKRRVMAGVNTIKTLGKDPQETQANGISTQAVPLSTHATPLSTHTAPLSTPTTKLSTPATASSKRLVMAGVNTIKSLLKIIGSLSDNIPVPGLKPASELLLGLIEGIQDTQENAMGFQKLAERLESLNGLILYAVQSEGNMSQTLPFLQRLEREFESVREDIEEALNQGQLTRFLNSADDKLSVATHIASLDSIIVDFSAAVGIDIKESITRMLFLISQMHEMLGKVPKNTEKASDPPGWMKKRLRREFHSGNTWQEVDSNEGAVYTASFAGDPTSFTTYQLEIVDNVLVKWTIRAPTSAWYPGIHSGILDLPSDYPFQKPTLRFESPLFSPYISANGFISTAMLFNDWAPNYVLKDILDTVAFMIVIEPFPTMFHDKTLPGIPLDFHLVNPSVQSYVDARGRDAFMQATNFFARVYSQAEVEFMTDPPIMLQELEMSVVVIKDLLMHFTKKDKLDKVPEGSISNDPEVSFNGTVILRISDWRREERRWAEAILPFFLEGWRPPPEHLAQSINK